MRARLVVVMPVAIGALVAVLARVATADEPAPRPTDGAGIPDTRDACPDEPVAQRRAGCPTRVTVCADCDVGPLTVRIAYGRTQVHPRRGDWPVLRAVADVMLAPPELRVRVEGHSDSRGTEVRHHVRLLPEGDRCSCPWFSKHQGQRGPCKHILAAQLCHDE